MYGDNVVVDDKKSNIIGIILFILSLVLFMLTVFLKLGVVFNLVLASFGMAVAIIGIVKLKRYLKLLGVIALLINILPILGSLLFENPIWPNLMDDYLNLKYCASAVQCKDCVDNKCTCKYYEDDGSISKNTIKCDTTSSNNSGSIYEDQLWNAIKDEMRNQTYCSSAVQCGDCNGKTCKCRYFDADGNISKDVIECNM